MKPHFAALKNPETQNSIIVDMEGPYHPEGERIGEHIYGVTLLIDGVPYHFEKYIPTQKEFLKFQNENEGEPQLSGGRFLYRLVAFTK